VLTQAASKLKKNKRKTYSFPALLLLLRFSLLIFFFLCFQRILPFFFQFLGFDFKKFSPCVLFLIVFLVYNYAPMGIRTPVSGCRQLIH